jgi:cobalt-zinc-cadmium efflux system outer membrane protein
LRAELRDYSADELMAHLEERPDVRERLSKIDEAEAEMRLGRALRWPAIGVGARYEREENADIILGEAAVSLPIFQRGHGTRGEAAARARRLRIELEAARAAARNAVRSGFEAYRRRVEAARELAVNALPLLDENETLARRSYESGQRPLSEWIFARKEALEAKREHLNRLLEAAIAGVELEAAAGVLR